MAKGKRGNTVTFLLFEGFKSLPPFLRQGLLAFLENFVSIRVPDKLEASFD
jgi:hypothetical protein